MEYLQYIRSISLSLERERVSLVVESQRLARETRLPVPVRSTRSYLAWCARAREIQMDSYDFILGASLLDGRTDRVSLLDFYVVFVLFSFLPSSLSLFSLFPFYCHCAVKFVDYEYTIPLHRESWIVPTPLPPTPHQSSIRFQDDDGRKC
jgi:hypothetical protein